MHNFCAGDDDNKNVYTLPLKAIQTFSGVNNWTSCRQPFIHSNTQHKDNTFCIHTESDMLQWKVRRLIMYILIVVTVGLTCTVVQ